MARFKVYLEIRSGIDGKTVRECNYVVAAKSKKEAKSKAARMAEDEVEFDPRIQPYLCFFVAEREEKAVPKKKARVAQLVHKRVPVVDEGQLYRFLDQREPGKAARLDEYWKARLEEITDDSYHRIYVNKKGTPLDRDLPALKEALGLGDDESEYFLVYHAW